MDRGIIYIVSEKQPAWYYKEAVFSAKSVKRWNPKIPIALFSNMKNIDTVFDDHYPVTGAENGHYDKVYALANSPYDDTIFLDTDTQALKDISPLFDMLQQHDIAIAGEPSFLKEGQEEVVGTDHYNYNTGLIVYRKNEAVKKFLDQWYALVVDMEFRLRYFSDKYHGDQGHFNYLFQQGAMKDLGINMKVLDNTVYNVRGSAWPMIKKEGRWDDVALLHKHGLWRSPLEQLKGKLKFKLKKLFK